MKIYSCETHINHALDVFVAEQEKFPIMEVVSEEEKLSTKCTYCEEPHYMLWRTNSRTQYVDKCCGYVHKFCL